MLSQISKLIPTYIAIKKKVIKEKKNSLSMLEINIKYNKNSRNTKLNDKLWSNYLIQLLILKKDF